MVGADDGSTVIEEVVVVLKVVHTTGVYDFTRAFSPFLTKRIQGGGSRSAQGKVADAWVERFILAVLAHAARLCVVVPHGATHKKDRGVFEVAAFNARKCHGMAVATTEIPTAAGIVILCLGFTPEQQDYAHTQYSDHR